MTSTRREQVGLSRRDLMIGVAAMAALGGLPPRAFAFNKQGEDDMNTIKAQDGTEIYFKDWGAGQPVVFSHGWPLSADAWDAQMLFLAQRGYRVVAHDRRGHGRSGQSWQGNNMDQYADDLAELMNYLDLKEA